MTDLKPDVRLGGQVPLSDPFVTELGAPATIGGLLDGRPAVLALVYYQCPNVCGEVLKGISGTFKQIDLEAGRDYEVIFVSIEPAEGPELARAKKANTMKRIGRDESAAGWHFLTGPESSIKPLADAIGFRYSRTGSGNSIAHPAGIVVLTPQGKVSRAFYGVEYAPRDVRLGLIEAAEAKIGTMTDRVMLYLCWEYDPATGKYGVAVMNALRIGGVLTLLGLGAMIFVFARRDRRRARLAQGGHP